MPRVFPSDVLDEDHTDSIWAFLMLSQIFIMQKVRKMDAVWIDTHSFRPLRFPPCHLDAVPFSLAFMNKLVRL